MSLKRAPGFTTCRSSSAFNTAHSLAGKASRKEAPRSSRGRRALAGLRKKAHTDMHTRKNAHGGSRRRTAGHHSGTEQRRATSVTPSPGAGESTGHNNSLENSGGRRRAKQHSFHTSQSQTGGTGSPTARGTALPHWKSDDTFPGRQTQSPVGCNTRQHAVNYQRPVHTSKEVRVHDRPCNRAAGMLPPPHKHSPVTRQSRACRRGGR